MNLETLKQNVLHLPRWSKRLLALAVDVLLCVSTVWLAMLLRYSDFVPVTQNRVLAALMSVAIALPIFSWFGFYQAVFRYSGWPALLTVTKAVFVYGLVFSAAVMFAGWAGVPRTIGFIQPMLLLLLIGASRAFVRYWLGGLYETFLKRSTLPKVLIYGAGSTGRQLAAAMTNSHELVVTGFFDDDAKLHGRTLNGLPVYPPSDLPDLKAALNISGVLLAIPSVSKRRRGEIVRKMLEERVFVRTLPSVDELVQGRIGPSHLRDLDLDELIGRDPVEPDQLLLVKNIRSKIVLVTGAGGSIGSELCRQIIKAQPHTMILVEQSEFALYQIQNELKSNPSIGSARIVTLLLSTSDADQIAAVFATWRPDTIYHAAAYKHVPMVERNPVSGIRNNVFGTLNVAKAALANEAKDFVLISTDKAVRPTNIMGASKRLAEMTLQAMAAKSPGTTFTMVRFGNVLESSGSVVPKFRRQIKEGGPVTVTHPEITRYFMTIPEAAQLVIQAGAMASGGDVFVLDMGQEVRILDLAKRMIELAGLRIKDSENPDGDIEIEFIGLRPGEKLYEELLIGENPVSTVHPRIMRTNESFLDWAVLEKKLFDLSSLLAANDVDGLRELLGELVDGYVKNDRVVDWMHLERSATGK